MANSQTPQLWINLKDSRLHVSFLSIVSQNPTYRGALTHIITSPMMEPTHSLRPAVWNAAEEKDLTAWNKHRDTLQYLYVDEGCSLKAIKQKMETEHGFPSFRCVLLTRTSHAALD
jgi:hypothetical protein